MADEGESACYSSATHTYTHIDTIRLEYRRAIATSLSYSSEYIASRLPGSEGWLYRVTRQLSETFLYISKIYLLTAPNYFEGQNDIYSECENCAKVV